MASFPYSNQSIVSGGYNRQHTSTLLRTYQRLSIQKEKASDYMMLTAAAGPGGFCGESGRWEGGRYHFVSSTSVCVGSGI